MTRLWAKNIPRLPRQHGGGSAQGARKTLEENGVKFVDPPAEELAAVPASMMIAEQDRR